jgi:hypothetical protein
MKHERERERIRENKRDTEREMGFAFCIHETREGERDRE